MIQSDAIRLNIRENMKPGTKLKTTGGAKFFVEAITPLQIIFRVGEKKQKLSVDLACIEDMVKEFRYLPPGGWMQIAASPGTPKPGTLNAAVQPHSHGGNATSHFAAVLEHLSLAELNPNRPASIRLTI